jgi:serine protease inhibitor
MTHPKFFARILAVGVLGLAAAGGVSRAPAAEAVPVLTPASVAGGNNGAALRLRNILAEMAEGEANFYVSPNSFETVLAMTCAGARSPTADQLVKAMYLPAGATDLHAAFGALIKGLNAEPRVEGKQRYQGSVTGALWGQKGEAFLPEFLKVLKDNYGAGLSEVDFGDTAGVGKTINAWAEKETGRQIKDLLKAPIPGADTRLVLANALCLKGNWAVPFKKEDIREAPFQVAVNKVGYTEGTPVSMPARMVEVTYAPQKVPMLNSTGTYGYFEDKDLQGLKLPLKGEELSMVLLLPRKLNGLQNLERTLTLETLETRLKTLAGRQVAVSIPKFKAAGEYQFSQVLESMGTMSRHTDADYSAMTGKKDLFISKVIHRACLEVNEEGAEAAGVTALVMSRGGPAPQGQGWGVAHPMNRGGPLSEEPALFKADHPFLFIIRHEKSGTILFMGRVGDPTK